MATAELTVVPLIPSNIVDMDVLLRDTIGVRASHVKTTSADSAVCVVNREWLEQLVAGRKIPPSFRHQEHLTDTECSVLVHQPSSALSQNFCFVTVIRIPKLPNRQREFVSLRLKEPWSRSHDLGYLELVRYVSETNYRNIWKEANSASSRTRGSQDRSSIKLKPVKEYNTAIREILSRLYACPVIRQSGDNDPTEDAELGTPHPNLVPAYCAIETPAEFLLFLEFREHTAEHCAMFSAAVLVGSRLLFVVLQLLRLLRYLHDLGLPLGPVTLGDLSLDHRFWLQATPPWWLALQQDSWEETFVTKEPLTKTPARTKVLNTDGGTSSSLPPLNFLVDEWVRGRMSNFEYLMALNQLCGRQSGNPCHHPVLPWVRDLNQAEGGWRDLGRSKMRLTRGDRQLDLTYESASLSQTSQPPGHAPLDRAVQVPHHVSEALSDITYYVYLSRRLPRSVLCEHVRRKWVPAEYPASVQRLQEWSPNECIPEFFTDPTVFKSIHEDLPDLEVPPWCSGPEDFIRRHMGALESERVSEHLHHWIDITFGYKLTGAAAVKSKNVCLPLVDGHTSLHSCGVVQLFTVPHPHRAAPSLYHSRFSPPKTFRLQHTSSSSGSPLLRVGITTSSRRKGRQDGSEKEVCADSKENEEEGVLEVFQTRRKSINIVKSRSVGQQLGAGPAPVPAETQVIVLPKDYSPLVKLQQVESLCAFCLHHPPHHLPPSIAATASNQVCDSSPGRHRSPTSHAADMYLLGCLLVEMSAFSAASPHSSRNLAERYAYALQVLKLYPSKLPKCLQNAVRVLLQTEKPPIKLSALGESFVPGGTQLEWRYPCVCEGGLPPPSAHQLLQPLLSTIPFPSHYPALYEFLSTLSALATAPEKVNHVSRGLPKLLTSLSQQDLDLVMGHLSDLFSHRDSSLLAVWQLFDLVGTALGPRGLAERLLGVLLNLMSPEQPTVRHLRLFHRSFLLKLQVRLGLKTFLHLFATLLVEAVGGYRDTVSQSVDTEHPSVPRTSSHLSTADYEPLMEPRLRSREPSPSRLDPSGYTDDESNDPSSSPVPPGEPEMFQLEADPEESPPFTYEGEPKPSTSFMRMPRWPPRQEGDHNLGLAEKSHGHAKAHDISMPSTSSALPPNIEVKLLILNIPHEATSDDSVSGNCSMSDVAAESVVWLAHRLGPVLTAKHLSRNLLRMLTLCYLGPQQLCRAEGPPADGDVSLFEHWVVGDQTAAKVLDTLSNVAMLYGESFIILQYLPHVADLLRLCKRHLTETLEAGLIGAVTLVKHVLPLLSDTTLMSHLQEVVLKNILYPLIQLASSLHHCFPGGAASRGVLTRKIADTLYLVGLRIGFQMSRRHLSALLQRFFASFNRAFHTGPLSQVEHLTPLQSMDDYLYIKKDGSSQEYKIGTPVKMSSVLPMQGSPPYSSSPPLESDDSRETTYSSCLSCMKIFYDQMLIKIFTIRYSTFFSRFDSIFDSKTSIRYSHTPTSCLCQDEAIVSGEFGKNVAMVGNRIDVQLGEESHLVAAGELPDTAPKYDINLLMRKMTNSQRHLRGNWLAYWEHEIGRSDKDAHFNFKQIKLQSFSGHTGGVRSLEVLDNENSFLSGSKDRTVKLWSLRSSGDGSTVVAPQWTYPHHRKSVVSVAFLPSLRLVGSTDYSVHIWDPFMGSCLKQFDSSKTHPVTALFAMPSPSTTFLAATSNSTVRFLDARTMRYTHEVRVSTGSAGVVRCLAVGPSGNWLAVGHSSGVLSVLDVRTGFMLGTWVAHDGEILQAKAFNDTYFVSSSLDHAVSVWNAEEAKLHCHLRGSTEPVTCLSLYQGEVISGTSASKVNVHSSIDPKASFTSTKLRSDTFRGVLASMAVLPLNRLLLLGADNGNITLLC
ncbi:unnamed protein product [Ixodes hexagonus]